MNRRKLLKNMVFRFIIFTLAVLPLLLAYSWGSPSASTMTFDSNINFKLPAYDSYIKFNEDYSMASFTWNDDGFDASSITFNDLTMNGNAPSSWEVTLTQGNVTFTNLFDKEELEFTWIGSGASSITFTSTARGKPAKVEINFAEEVEGVKWSYDDATNQVTITDTLSSKNVKVSWILTGGGIIQVPAKPISPPSIEPIINNIIIYAGTGIVVILVLILIHKLYEEGVFD